MVLSTNSPHISSLNYMMPTSPFLDVYFIHLNIHFYMHSGTCLHGSTFNTEVQRRNQINNLQSIFTARWKSHIRLERKVWYLFPAMIDLFQINIGIRNWKRAWAPNRPPLYAFQGPHNLIGPIGPRWTPLWWTYFAIMSSMFVIHQVWTERLNDLKGFAPV